MTGIDLLGYFSLGLNQFSMSMTHIHHLRIISITANSLFAVYGYLLHAMPIVIAACVAVTIHAIKLMRNATKPG